ncbi:two-component system sensor histidine kinase QseC [Vibrio sp. ES.051]|uniref:sensor histidine kinase n=1 Tax=Vibrio sp. ES.051 TaxID=1761909 RepID=UPI000BF36983|nr:ATP-binding protein [Vibrio sp. ES.051]PFG56245.1 two-component system sensor histidine kinase QseC [Vibrio sp. ES.051]
MRNKKPYSIKRQLTLSVGILVSVLLLISLYFSFQSAKHEVEEVYDARLGQSAKLMLLTLSISTQENTLANHKELFDQWMKNIELLAKSDDDQATKFGHPYEQNLVFQFYRNNKLFWSSSPSLQPLSSSFQNNGYANVIKNGVQWRTFQLSLPRTTYQNEFVVVAEKQEIRQEIIHEIALSTSIEQLLLLPTLLLLLFWLIDRYFRPIKALQSAITQRHVHRLDRIHVTDNTIELAPLIKALNALLSELELAWQREKRFTRAAAHELKTPLTILRLNIENALESNDPEQLRGDLHNILQGIDRTDRLIHQLLTLAKVESFSERGFDSIELTPLLQTVIADLAPLALRQNQDISLLPSQAQLAGDRMLLEVLFRNLIDNAIRYSGNGSEILVSMIQNQNTIKVLISDTGPEIPPETRERLFEQFYRGHSETGDGAGLGMSICKDIATLHSATIELALRENEMNTFVVAFPKTDRKMMQGIT